MVSSASPEFSHPIDLAHLDHGSPMTVDLAPNADQISALTKRLDLLGLDGFTARLTATRLDDGTIAVGGTLSAAVVQRCGVTLNPVPGTVDETVDILFLPPDRFAVWEETTDLEEMLEGPDVEPLEGPTLDLGEIATQSLALGLDPFPRDPSAQLPAEAIVEEEPTEEGALSPFAKLAMLKGRS